MTDSAPSEMTIPTVKCHRSLRVRRRGYIVPEVEARFDEVTDNHLSDFPTAELTMPCDTENDPPAITCRSHRASRSKYGFLTQNLLVAILYFIGRLSRYTDLNRGS